MKTERAAPLNRQILEEAAEWLVEFDAGDADPTARQRFDTWLRASPEHVRAYLELLPLWEEGAAPAPRDAGAEALIAWGRQSDNVVPITDAASSSPQVEQTPGFNMHRRVAAAAAVLLIGAAAISVTWLTAIRDPVYVTDIAEQRSIALSDGSVVDMNARSSIRVRFTDGQRNVDLLQGQALFRVAKDHARPFVVASDGTHVRAVGTQFDVHRRASGTTVTVLEGRVAVLRDTDAAPPLVDGFGQAPRAGPTTAATDPSLAGAIFVSGGEQLIVTAQAAVSLAPARTNLAAATAWTQRRLVFDATTLADVAEEFNRYNTRRIVLRDTALERFPITAAFSSTDPASLVRFLEAQPGIRVIKTDDEIQIATSR
jgi:transmembrane sensor